MQFKGTGSLLLKDLDTKQGIVQAYWSAFGNIDDQGDIVEPGCWSKSIRERGPRSKQPRIKFLWQHQETMLLGKPSELIEDSFGLLATCQIIPTTLGKDCLLLYEAEVLSEHSVGYEVIQAQWDHKTGARRLIEACLWEGSCVTWGANSETPVVGLKSLTQPSHLLSMADRAQKIDKLLHDGSLRSDMLCQSLERELKSLHAALAPSTEAERPYDIKGVIDSMTELATRLQSKAASDDDKKAQEARSKKYHIGIKDGGHVTKPSANSDVPDEEWGDPVNYRYPMKDKAHADNAAARFGAESAREQYTSDEQDIIAKRIMKRQKDFDEDPDWWPLKDDGAKGADMGKRLIKSADGDIEVSEDGTHGAFTGTHTHSHKAMGSQGEDEMHEHAHSHKGDGRHSHDHEKAASHAHPHKDGHRAQMQKAENGRTIRKARDFGTLFAALNESDQLQDDWGDTFIAMVNAMEELMWQSCMQNGGYMPEGAEQVDIEAAAKENLAAFSDAVMGLVSRSVAADFVPQMDWDGDQFLDPDGVNAHSPYDDDDDYDDWKSAHTPQRMPDAPAPLRKAGRAISGANRETITKALDGMSEAMKAMKAHHGTIADLMTKTDPDAVRQDEDDTQGDSDAENGGNDINKSRFTPRNHPAPERHEKAATTQGFDLSDLDDTLSALRSRS